MKCSFLGYVQLLIISQAVRWTQTPSATPLQPIKWNAHFWITFNFWWSAGLVDGLEPYPPPVCSQKMKCSYFDYVQLLMIGRAGQWTQTPSTAPLQPKKWNASFMEYIQLLMIGRAEWWTRTPSTTPLQPKKWNPHFCITFNIWCWPDWSMDLNLIHHPSPANKMKCSFLGYVQLMMISRAVRWTQTPSATPLQPIKWNAHFWITFTLDDQPAWPMDSNSIHHPSPPKKNEMLIFGLCSTSDDQPGWSMDSNHICHPSPNKKNEMLIFGLCPTSDVGQTGQWTQTPSTTPLQPK